MSRYLTDRKLLIWSEKHQDFYDRQDGLTLQQLKTAARAAGFHWTIDYPPGRKQPWCWFKLTRSASQKRLYHLRGRRE